MAKTCPKCGTTVDENSRYCQHCGASLSNAVTPSAKKRPLTIEELQAWYTYHHLPPETVTRFFIGKNITEPKAFGIYKNDRGEFVVYKNKSTGERAVRYQGTDEAFAVNELYQKLRDEIQNQKARQSSKKVSTQQAKAPAPRRNYSSTPQRNYSGTTQRSYSSKSSGGSSSSSLFSGGSGFLKKTGIAGAIVAGLFGIYSLADHVPDGYYRYNGTEYYHQGSSWYRYNRSYNNWSETGSMGDFITDENASDYRIYDHTGMRFEDTQWYDDGSSYSSSYDDDDDDDSYWDDDDDWDNDNTDWDSDW